MNTTYRAQYDFIVLKPVWLSLLIPLFVNLFHGAWKVSAVLTVMEFAIGYIGGRLYPNWTYKVLASGRPSLDDVAVKYTISDVSRDDRFAVTSASNKLNFVFGIGASLLLFRSHGVLLSAFLGFVIWILGAIVMAILYEVISRQLISGRIRLLGIGMIIFWAGASIYYVPVALFIRALST